MITKLTTNQVKTDYGSIHKMELLNPLILVFWFAGRFAEFVMTGAALAMISAIWRLGPMMTIIMVVPIMSIVKGATMISPVSEAGVTPWTSVPHVI